MTDKRAPRTRRSEPPLDDLKKERDDFIKTFFQKGAQLTEELVREREKARNAQRALEEENARLRSQIASDDAIRDLLRKIDELEHDKEKMLRRFHEAEAASSQHQAQSVEIESELASLANLYVASFQLHSSVSPRGVMRHVKELLGQLVGAEAFAIYLVDDRGQELVPVASEGIAEAELSPLLSGEGPIGLCFSQKRTTDILRDTRKGSLSEPAVCFPLVFEDRAVGAVAIFRTLEQKSAFIPVDHELFKLLGAQAMWALIAARQFTDGGRTIPPLSSFRDLGTLPMADYSCLIVEDSPMMRQLLVFALARVKSLRVTEADDGVDALRKLAATKFDIIITDINMPIMDGLKLVKRIRTDPTHKDTPIVIITTEGSQEDRQRALQLGANAYITKPIQAPQVIAKVKELLKIE